VPPQQSGTREPRLILGLMVEGLRGPTAGFGSIDKPAISTSRRRRGPTRGGRRHPGVEIRPARTYGWDIFEASLCSIRCALRHLAGSSGYVVRSTHTNHTQGDAPSRRVYTAAAPLPDLHDLFFYDL